MAGSVDAEGLVKYRSWTPATFVRGGLTTRGVLPGYVLGDVTGINDAGQAVGGCSFFPESAPQHAVLWTLAHQSVLPGRVRRLP